MKVFGEMRKSCFFGCGAGWLLARGANEWSWSAHNGDMKGGRVEVGGLSDWPASRLAELLRPLALGQLPAASTAN